MFTSVQFCPSTDSAETLSQSFLQDALVSSSGMARYVHSFMLSIQHFLCRPRRRPPPTQPWRMDWRGCRGVWRHVQMLHKLLLSAGSMSSIQANRCGMATISTEVGVHKLSGLKKSFSPFLSQSLVFIWGNNDICYTPCVIGLMSFLAWAYNLHETRIDTHLQNTADAGSNIEHVYSWLTQSGMLVSSETDFFNVGFLRTKIRYVIPHTPPHPPPGPNLLPI